MATNVYLVPGFFGFTSLGAVSYFNRVRDVLDDALRDRGVDATIVECGTQPTGSIRRRADRLLDDILRTGGHEADNIHLVGHSTGGLDIRLLSTPGVRLRDDDSEEVIAGKTRSVISLATPHFGTPIANFFTTLPGRQLLEVLTVLATSTSGRYAIFAGARLLKLVSRVDDIFGLDKTILDSLAARLLPRLSKDRDDPMYQFLREVAADQGAIIQLTPESMHLFNAAVTDREGVSYASLVTAAPPPPRYYKTSDFFSLARAAMAGAFTFMHSVAAREHGHYPYPHPGYAALAPLSGEVTFELDGRSNDGVVPTLSQVYGKVLDLVVGDHLDVVGQFPGASDDPHSDWLPSGAGYDEARFRRTWGRIADEIAATNQ